MRFMKTFAFVVATLIAVPAFGGTGPPGGERSELLPSTAGQLHMLDLPPGADPVPIPAVEAVVELLAEFPVVALGESHNLAEAGRFYAALVLSERFAAAADAVVVEFGNARFQATVDAYVAGGRVPRAELQRVWRDTTQVGAWDAPMYRAFFAAVRAANVDRPPSKRIRVVLGDPPIDWSRVDSAREVRDVLLRRERFMVRLIEREVLDEGLRAVVISGLAHLERSVGPVQHPNVTQILDRRHPGATWVVGMHLGFPRPEWEAALGDWPIPSIAALAGTWIGALPKADGLAEDALDAMLFLGAADGLHLSVPLPSVYRDDGYWRTLRERWPIGVGGPFSARAVVAAYADPGYPGRFTQREIAALEAFARCMRDHAVEAFPDPQYQYDAVGFYGPALDKALADPDYPAALDACISFVDASSAGPEGGSTWKS